MRLSALIAKLATRLHEEGDLECCLIRDHDGEFDAVFDFDIRRWDMPGTEPVLGLATFDLGPSHLKLVDKPQEGKSDND